MNNKKVGIFLCKDTKISALQAQNQTLRKNLESQLQIFEQLSLEGGKIEADWKSMQTNNNFLSLEQVMLEQSIAKLKDSIAEIHPHLVKSYQVSKSLNQSINKLQSELQQKLMLASQQQCLLQRYKEEQKNEKLMIKSDKNICKIAETYRKSHQNYIKNIQILQDKLEGKKRYLGILNKKLLKNRQLNEQQQKEGQKKKINILNNTNIKAYKGQISKKQDKKQQKLTRQRQLSMKNMNDIIRKKNAILNKR